MTSNASWTCCVNFAMGSEKAKEVLYPAMEKVIFLAHFDSSVEGEVIESGWLGVDCMSWERGTVSAREEVVMTSAVLDSMDSSSSEVVFVSSFFVRLSPEILSSTIPSSSSTIFSFLSEIPISTFSSSPISTLKSWINATVVSLSSSVFTMLSVVLLAVGVPSRMAGSPPKQFSLEAALVLSTSCRPSFDLVVLLRNCVAFESTWGSSGGVFVPWWLLLAASCCCLARRRLCRFILRRLDLQEPRRRWIMVWRSEWVLAVERLTVVLDGLVLLDDLVE